MRSVQEVSALHRDVLGRPRAGVNGAFVGGRVTPRAGTSEKGSYKYA